MQRIGLEIYTSAYEAVRILGSVADHRVEMEIPVGSVLLDNILNLRIIEDNAKKLGKQVSFSTSDPFGKNLIKILNGENDAVLVREPEPVKSVKPLHTKPGVSMPSVALPKVKLGINFKKAGLIIPVVLILLAGVGIMILRGRHKAQVALYFSPQILTKSVTVKVGDNMKTNLESKVLAGVKITRSVDHSLTADSTGSKLEGEKAKGEVTLYNSTVEEITLKKGTLLTYKSKDKSYVFLTNSEVKVPKRTEPSLTETTIIKGTAKVGVTAESIGPDYNIKKEKELSVKGYKTSELSAASNADFKGGTSKEVPIVTQADITKLQNDLVAYVSSNPDTTLKNAVSNGYNYVDKSGKLTNNSVVINNKVGDEKQQLTGSITAQVEGLTYSRSDLADFMGKLSQNLVPPGFEFHSYNNDIKVEVLGNTENTVLSSTQADLQVTFKFFISPKLEKDKIFNDIKGMNLSDAEKVLSGITDVEKVELSAEPGMPFFQKIPTNIDKVVIETKIQE